MLEIHLLWRKTPLVEKLSITISTVKFWSVIAIPTGVFWIKNNGNKYSSFEIKEIFYLFYLFQILSPLPMKFPLGQWEWSVFPHSIWNNINIKHMHIIDIILKYSIFIITHNNFEYTLYLKKNSHLKPIYNGTSVERERERVCSLQKSAKYKWIS